MKKLTFKPLIVLPLVLAVVAALGWILHSRAPAADKPAVAPRPALTVTASTVQMNSLALTLNANGNVAAWQEASIGSELSGMRLTEVRVNVGDTVRAGQVLAVFAADAVSADVAQAGAALQEAQATAAEAAANAARARALQTTGALSAQQISQYLTAEQTASARIASASAALAIQRLRLRHTQVVAPDAGLISARSATVGAVAGAGTELFRMIRQGRLEWRAEVTAAELPQIKTGAPVLVKAANGSELTGHVRSVAPTVDLQTRTALVYVDLPAASAAAAPFKAGMFASGQFALGVSNAMTLPQQAIAVRDGFSYVFRLNSDQHVSRVQVQTGRRVAGRVEVTGALTPETPVVISGAGFLNDGDLVHTVAAAAAAR